MFFAIDPQSDTAIYQQIVNAVCADIRAGRLPYGTQLPTVRALADELGLAARSSALTTSSASSA